MPVNLFEGGINLAIELNRPAGPYYPGDVIHATVALDSEKETEISEFRVGLLAWEVSIVEGDEGSGSRHTTVDETVTGQTLMGETTLAAGYHGTYQVDLPIPADAFQGNSRSPPQEGCEYHGRRAPGGSPARGTCSGGRGRRVQRTGDGGVESLAAQPGVGGRGDDRGTAPDPPPQGL